MKKSFYPLPFSYFCIYESSAEATCGIPLFYNIALKLKGPVFSQKK